jgi:hypothetical protein
VQVVSQLILSLVILVSCGLCSQSSAAELIGLRGLALTSEDHIWGFDIKLAKGRIIAACQIPTGWTVNAESYGEAGNYKDGGGEIKGSADLDHDTLTRTDISRLSGFILIGLSEVHGKFASLSGSIEVASVTVAAHKISLGPKNFLRLPAHRCPGPLLSVH